MVKRSLIPLLIALSTTAMVAGACSSSSSSKSSSSAAATTVPSGDKTKFCAANAQLSADFAKAAAPTDLLGILKQDASVIATFEANAPADIKVDAQVLVDAANAAGSANDVNKLNTPAVQASGPKVDAYCGQTTSGTPTTAAAAATGDKATLCVVNSRVDAIFAANPTDTTALLAALKAVQADIDGAVKIAPSDIAADVQTLVTATDGAIATNDATKLQAADVTAAGSKLDAYCGVSPSTTTVTPTTA